MNELDFTLELNSDSLNNNEEAALFREADTRLRELVGDHNDITSSAINIRHPGPATFEATVVVYGRENLAATQKDADPDTALKNALSAVERQVRQRRAKMRRSWEKPGNSPVEQEVMEVLLAETQLPEMTDEEE
jgi:ribosome-associated translation inhibitor RaiA